MKVKFLIGITIIQTFLCLFFLLFSIVTMQKAEKNFNMAIANEKMANKQKQLAKVFEIRLKECQEKNK
jgi:hypothetical protein